MIIRTPSLLFSGTLGGAYRCQRIASLTVAVLLGGSVLLAGCGGKSAEVVTETGNPPFLDQSKLEVRAKDGKVVVVGGPEAVPGQAQVKVTNRTSGDEQSTTAAANGSFELELNGEPGDELRIEVDSERGSKTFDVDVEGLEEPETDASVPLEPQSCNEIYDLAQERLEAAFDEADTSCSGDADCVIVTGGPACIASCAAVALSVDGAASVDAVRGDIEVEQCSVIEGASCLPQPGCDPIDLFPNGVGCIDGQCGARRFEPDPPQPDPSGPAQPSPDTPAPDEMESAQCVGLSDQLMELETNLLAADRSCTVDEDCVVVDAGSNCWSSCAEESISVAGQMAVDELRERLEQEVCPEFTRLECPVSNDGCVTIERFPNGAGCIDGVCGAQLPACGGFAGDTCGETEYCAYEEGELCGATDASSNCRPRPEACDRVLAPVCGCDGIEYDNGCEAARAGTGVHNAGECAVNE